MSPQTGAARLVLPPSPAAPTNHLRDAITAYLDTWADESDALAVEHRIEGYRAALEDPATDLLAIATELEVPL